MRPQCAIVFASAIVLAVADVSVTINAKPIQTGDVPIKRLLRSETSVDVDGEERGNGFKNFKLWGESSTTPNPAEADAATKLQDIKDKMAVELRKYIMVDFFNEHYGRVMDPLLKYNKKHSGGGSPMSMIREYVDDASIIYGLHRMNKANPTKQTQSFTNLRVALFDEWIRKNEHLDSVTTKVQDVAGGNSHTRFNINVEEWTRIYETMVQSKINQSNAKLINLSEDITNSRRELLESKQRLESLRGKKRESYKAGIADLEATIRQKETEKQELLNELVRLRALIPPP